MVTYWQDEMESGLRRRKIIKFIIRFIWLMVPLSFACYWIFFVNSGAEKNCYCRSLGNIFLYGSFQDGSTHILSEVARVLAAAYKIFLVNHMGIFVKRNRMYAYVALCSGVSILAPSKLIASTSDVVSKFIQIHAHFNIESRCYHRSSYATLHLILIVLLLE